MPTITESHCQCPSCKEVFAASKWDAATLKNCTNRKLRRSYVSIEKSKSFKVLKWYECPGCGKAHYNKDIKEVGVDLNV